MFLPLFEQAHLRPYATCIGQQSFRTCAIDAWARDVGVADGTAAFQQNLLMLKTSLLDVLINAICNPLRRVFITFLLRRSRHIYPKMTADVSRLTKATVLKRGVPWQLRLEAEATRYAAKHTSIPIPATYDFWTGYDGLGYLVMEYKEGEVLQRKWRFLSDEQKWHVLHVVKGYIAQLRAIQQPSPSGWIGSVFRKAFFDFGISGARTYGPFRDECEYNDWRISTFSECGVKHPITAKRLKELRAEMPDDHRITFTHGDITRYNLLVRVDGPGKDDIVVTALLDWEQAGWRPEFWETHKFVNGAGSRDWAQLGRSEVVPGYDAELAREHELIHISGPQIY